MNTSEIAITFFIGLIITSLAVGTLADQSAWGWLVLGGGLLTSSILGYLNSGSGKS